MTPQHPFRKKTVTFKFGFEEVSTRAELSFLIRLFEQFNKHDSFSPLILTHVIFLAGHTQL